MKNILDIIQALFTILAIIIGGIWSYMLFIKRRQRFPRAIVEHQVFHKTLAKDKILLNLTTIITNTGEVLLELEKCVVRIQQIWCQFFACPVFPALS
jgi:nitrate reductase gamma subunit